ncbi:hypothetical protein C8J56DRAFT_1050959 [Mycena floridula]|nr:hypothetical protein C8J56DRAFT_1050959 [Mycena floridula]
MAENVSRQNGPVTVQKQITLEQGIIVPQDTCRTIMQNDPTGAEELEYSKKFMSTVMRSSTGRPYAWELSVSMFMGCMTNAASQSDIYVIPIQMMVDCGVEIFEMFAEHTALCWEYSPVLGEVDAFIGHNVKEVNMLGKSSGYFIPTIQLHVRQPGKVLPSATTLNTIWKLPGNFGLINCGTPVTKQAVDILRANLGKSREECMRWVSDDFEARAVDVFTRIGSPQLELIRGWGTFTEMLAGLTGE